MIPLEVLEDDAAAAERGARTIAVEARAAVEARGLFTFAVSGGRTPWIMLRSLSGMELPWHAVHLFQVDERAAPEGHADRNFTHVREQLLARPVLRPAQVHPMPVDEVDLDQAARRYASDLAAVAGEPPVLDLVHLGLGVDGHTASLVPGDAVLEIEDRDVAATAPYQGRRRLTLTFPLLNRARRILWLVTGAEKASVLTRLYEGDLTIPAGRVRRERARVVADRSATAGIRGTKEARP